MVYLDRGILHSLAESHAIGAQGSGSLGTSMEELARGSSLVCGTGLTDLLVVSELDSHLEVRIRRRLDCKVSRETGLDPVAFRA